MKKAIDPPRMPPYNTRLTLTLTQLLVTKSHVASSHEGPQRRPHEQHIQGQAQDKTRMQDNIATSLLANLFAQRNQLTQSNTTTRQSSGHCSLIIYIDHSTQMGTRKAAALATLKQMCGAHSKSCIIA